jgi:hypothetical protein
MHTNLTSRVLDRSERIHTYVPNDAITLLVTIGKVTYSQ